MFAVPSALRTPGRRDAIATALLIVVMTVWHIAILRPDLEWQNDDAYQYLGHARNIALFQPYAEIGYIFTRRTAEIGPQQYPPGLPLLLAPIYTVAGFDSLKPYMAAGLVTMAAALTVLAVWCRHSPPAIPAFAVVAIFLANPTVTQYANAIVSEPLFTLFVMLGLYFIDRQDEQPATTRSAILGGLFIGLACITRSLGVALILALVIHTAVQKGRNWRPTALTLVVIAGISALTTVLTGGSSATDYSAGLLNYDWSAPFRNARLYAGDVALEILVPLPDASGLAKLAFLCFIGCTAAGVWRIWQERKGPTVWESFVLVYLSIVLVWPFYQGTRFLLPILPWAVRAAWIGLTDLSARLPSHATARYVPHIAAAIILLMYVPGMAAAFRARVAPRPDGVKADDVREVLGFLAHETGENARVITPRPRTIALLANRSAAGWPRDADDRTLAEHVREVRATHLVVDRSSPRDAYIYKWTISSTPSSFEPRFSNGRFTVFAVR